MKIKYDYESLLEDYNEYEEKNNMENFNPVFKVERGASIYGEYFASGERYSYNPIINIKVGNHEWLYNEEVDEYRVQTLSFDELMYELFMHSPFFIQ